MNSMNELLYHFMQDILYAEKTSLRSMAKLAKAVENPELRDAILQHREQTQSQIERLNEAFAKLGKKPRTKPCAAMDGLIEEGNEAIQEGEKGPVLDAALIACGQAIEHYEIARYGTMVAWAKQIGEDEVAELLQHTLDEEKASDERLNEIAEGSVNQQAPEEDEEDEDDTAEEAQQAAPKPAPKRAAPKRAPAARKPAAPRRRAAK